MNCKDGGTCHHDCQEFCFREECCEPLTLSNLNWNWTTKQRIVKRYRGAIIKVFNNSTLHQTMIKGWPAEWRIVSHGAAHNCPTSFRSLRAALRDAKQCVDNVHENERVKKIGMRGCRIIRVPKRLLCTRR